MNFDVRALQSKVVALEEKIPILYCMFQLEIILLPFLGFIGQESKKLVHFQPLY
jgi:hypothetical protein